MTRPTRDTVPIIVLVVLAAIVWAFLITPWLALRGWFH